MLKFPSIHLFPYTTLVTSIISFNQTKRTDLPKLFSSFTQ